MSAIDQAFLKAYGKSGSANPRAATRSVLETLSSEEDAAQTSSRRIEQPEETQAGLPAPHVKFDDASQQGIVMMDGGYQSSSFMVLPAANVDEQQQTSPGADQVEQERGEEERLEQLRLEQRELEAKQLERERVARQQLEQERLEQDRLEQLRVEQQRITSERLERERLERERLEQEQLERERLEQEQRERERLEQLRLEQERLEQLRIEQERLEQERLEQLRIEQERLEQERLEQLRIEQERLEKLRLEQLRLEKERLDQLRVEQQRLDQERLEAERLVQERLERERLERLEQERLELEQERLEQERLELERLELERQELDQSLYLQQQPSVIVNSGYGPLDAPVPTILQLHEPAACADAAECSGATADLAPPIESPDDERDAPPAKVEEAPTPAENRVERAPFTPAWEVDEFAWPAMCDELYDKQHEYFSESGRQLSAATKEGLNILAVTSNARGEGRSTVALCLARCAAEAGVKVALFDADVEHPQLATKLQMAPTIGWEATVLEGEPLGESAVTSTKDNLCLFPLTGRVASEPFALNSSSVSETWREAGRSFDLVIIDLSPVGDDVGQLFESGEDCPIDAAIVVRDLRTTDAFRLANVIEQLQKSGVDAVGVAENFAGEERAA